MTDEPDDQAADEPADGPAAPGDQPDYASSDASGDSSDEVQTPNRDRSSPGNLSGFTMSPGLLAYFNALAKTTAALSTTNLASSPGMLAQLNEIARIGRNAAVHQRLTEALLDGLRASGAAQAARGLEAADDADPVNEEEDGDVTGSEPSEVSAIDPTYVEEFAAAVGDVFDQQWPSIVTEMHRDVELVLYRRLAELAEEAKPIELGLIIGALERLRRGGPSSDGQDDNRNDAPDDAPA